MHGVSSNGSGFGLDGSSGERFLCVVYVCKLFWQEKRVESYRKAQTCKKSQKDFMRHGTKLFLKRFPRTDWLWSLHVVFSPQPLDACPWAGSLDPNLVWLQISPRQWTWGVRVYPGKVAKSGPKILPALFSWSSSLLP